MNFMDALSKVSSDLLLRIDGNGKLFDLFFNRALMNYHTFCSIVRKSNVDWLEGMHRDHFLDMVRINGYFVRNGLIKEFKRGLLRIGDKYDIPLVFPSVKDRFVKMEPYNGSLRFVDPEVQKIYTLEMLVLPTRFASQSSSDDVFLILTRNDMERVLMEFERLIEKFSPYADAYFAMGYYMSKHSKDGTEK